MFIFLNIVVTWSANIHTLDHMGYASFCRRKNDNHLEFIQQGILDYLNEPLNHVLQQEINVKKICTHNHLN